MGISIKCAAILLLPIALAACAGGFLGSDEGRSMSYTADRDGTNQPFPNNYRAEMLAFMKTYLNNPVGVHDAMIAEPVQRTVSGHMRYVSCLRFAPRESDGSYREPRERAIVYRRWPARPHGRERRRALRRCGLCGIPRSGKDDALAFQRVGKIMPRHPQRGSLFCFLALQTRREL